MVHLVVGALACAAPLAAQAQDDDRWQWRGSKAEYYEISETYTEDGVLTLVIGKEQIK